MTGWRKRTIVEMAREAGAVFPADGSYHQFERHEDLEAFAKLVREDEREACAKVCDSLEERCEKLLVPDEKWPTPADCANIIRWQKDKHD